MLSYLTLNKQKLSKGCNLAQKTNKKIKMFVYLEF